MASRRFRSASGIRITSIVAVLLLSFGSLDVHAADLTMNASTQWASGAGQDSSNVANATAGDNVQITNAAAQLTVTNNGGAANDGNGVGTYVIGNVTGTGSMDTGNNGGGVVTTTFASVDLTGNVTLRNTNAGNASVSHRVTGSVRTDANLNISNLETSIDGTTAAARIDGNVTANALTMTANVGAGAGAATTLRLDGSTITVATNITLDDNTGTSTLTFAGSSPQTVTGAILGAGAGEGRVFVTSDARFMSSIGATQLALFNVSATQKATLNGSVLGATTINNSGSMVFNNSVTASGTTFDLNAAGADNLATIILGTNSYTNNTVINATGVTNVNSTHIVNVTLPSGFASGTFTLIDGPGTGAGTADSAAKYTLTNSPNSVLSTYGVSIANTDDVLITATRKSAATITAETGTPEPLADVLLKIPDQLSGDPATLATVLGAIQSDPKDSAVRLVADTSQAPLHAAVNVAQSRVDAIGAHLAETSAGGGSGMTGVSTGDEPERNALWAKPFGAIGEQDAINLTPGYDFWSAGILVGIDRLVADEARVGLAFGYSYTDISGDAPTYRDSESNGYFFGVYGDVTWDALFLEWMAGYTLNDVATNRTIVLGTLNQTASGDYDIHQYSLQSKLGYAIELDERQQLIPYVGMLLDWQDPESYSEAGAGALNLNVQHDERFAALGQAGAEYRYRTDVNENVSGTYKLRSSVSYDFEGDNGRVTSSFVTGGNATQIEGEDVEEFGASFGGGIDFGFDQDRVVLGLGYDFELRSDFQAHVIQGEVRVRF